MQTAEQIDRALYSACVDLGYCNKLTGTSLLKKYNGKMTAYDFAASVLYAEGMTAKYFLT